MDPDSEARRLARLDGSQAETIRDPAQQGPASADGPSSGARSGVRADIAERDALFDDAHRYRHLTLIGRGGMGEVRLVHDARLGRDVAVKTLHDRVGPDSDAWQRFVREARVQGQLEHPAVAPVYDLGRDASGEPFIAMRYVQGRSLAAVLRDLSRKDPDTVAQWSRRKLLSAFVQVCLAVDYAHSRGVVHRDLKPANVMLGEFGEVQVLDWGVARVGAEPDAEVAPRMSLHAAVSDDPQGLTVEGSMLGTPGYMPPEQFLGDLSRIGPRSDVFALGMILYEILALEPYHRDRSPLEIVALVSAGIDPRPSTVVADVAPELDAVCVAATRPEPDDRLPSARSVAVAVERYLDGESDRARRSTLAAEHGAHALAAVSAPGAGSDADARRAAMREALQAMALDPGQRDAREAFKRLLNEVPDPLPEPVARAYEAAVDAGRREGVRVGTRAWIIWAATTPLLLYLGMRSPWVLVVSLASCGGGALYSLWLSRQPSLRGWQTIVYGLSFAVFTALLSGWLGPFVLVPAAVASVLQFGVAYGRKHERAAFIAMGVAAVAVPFALEATGALPRSYRFTPEGVLFVPRAMELKPVRTTVALLWTTLTYIAAPALYLGWLRDALSRAEKRRALQAWQLEQLDDAEG